MTGLTTEAEAEALAGEIASLGSFVWASED